MSDRLRTTLGNLLADGRALISGPFGSNISSRFFVEQGIPVIRGNNLTSGMEKFVDNGFVFVTEEKADELRADAVADDLIFTAAGTIGQVGLIPSDGCYERYIISNKQIRARLNTSKVDPVFAFYWFSAPQSVSNIQAHNTGSTIPLINLSVVRGLPIDLPSLEVQKGIVEVLGSLDDKIKLNRQMNETLEAMAQAIFRDWFVDFGPTRRKIDGATDPVEIMGGLVSDPSRAQELAARLPARMGDDGLPEGWESKAFSQFVNIIGGGTPKTTVPKYWDGQIPWFSVVDAPPDGSVFVLTTEKSITSEGVSGSSARLVRMGTTIISARGTVGKLALAGRDMTFNQSCYGLQGREGVGDCFVFLASQQIVERLRSMAHGSVFSTITRSTFEGIEMPNAPQSVLTAFETIIVPLFSKLKAGVEQNQILAATRDLLLPKLMSGEIRLRDAERAIDAIA